MIFAQVLDVVRENGIQVAHPVRSGEIKIRAIVFVEQCNAVVEKPIFGEPVAEVVGKGTPEPVADLRTGSFVERGQRRGQWRKSRIGWAAHLLNQCSKDFWSAAALLPL